nr:MAG TPA: Rubredoxin metal binding domain [Caudoviricetes sp.]
MTSPVCARCGCPASEYTASCRACYSRRRYRARAPKKPAATRQPVYTGKVAGRVPALNSLIPNRKDTK